jgi:hypothetical protein
MREKKTQSARPRVSIIRSMRFTWWKTKATDNHSECVMQTFSTAKVAYKRNSKLRNTYISRLVINKSAASAWIPKLYFKFKIDCLLFDKFFFSSFSFSNQIPNNTSAAKQHVSYKPPFEVMTHYSPHAGNTRSAELLASYNKSAIVNKIWY